VLARRSAIITAMHDGVPLSCNERGNASSIQTMTVACCLLHPTHGRLCTHPTHSRSMHLPAAARLACSGSTGMHLLLPRLACSGSTGMHLLLPPSCMLRFNWHAPPAAPVLHAPVQLACTSCCPRLACSGSIGMHLLLPLPGTPSSSPIRAAMARARPAPLPPALLQVARTCCCPPSPSRSTHMLLPPFPFT